MHTLHELRIRVHRFFKTFSFSTSTPAPPARIGIVTNKTACSNREKREEALPVVLPLVVYRCGAVGLYVYGP
jgi:hypothetical protein